RQGRGLRRLERRSARHVLDGARNLDRREEVLRPDRGPRRPPRSRVRALGARRAREGEAREGQGRRAEARESSRSGGTGAGPMRLRIAAAGLALVPLLALGRAPETAPAARTFAIVGATVHTASGADVPNGTVVVRDGKIASVGAGVAPAGVPVVDGKGRHV